MCLHICTCACFCACLNVCMHSFVHKCMCVCTCACTGVRFITNALLNSISLCALSLSLSLSLSVSECVCVCVSLTDWDTGCCCARVGTVYNFGLITWQSKGPAYEAMGTTHVAKKEQPCNCEWTFSDAEQDARDQDGLRCVFFSPHNSKAVLFIFIITDTFRTPRGADIADLFGKLSPPGLKMVSARLAAIRAAAALGGLRCEVFAAGGLIPWSIKWLHGLITTQFLCFVMPVLFFTITTTA